MRYILISGIVLLALLCGLLIMAVTVGGAPWGLFLVALMPLAEAGLFFYMLIDLARTGNL